MINAMHVTVDKIPDGPTFITHDSHGTLYDGDVETDAAPLQVGHEAELSVETRVAYDEPYLVGVFSWVDYKDTSTTAAHPTGVRHRQEWPVPSGISFGPYVLLATE